MDNGTARAIALACAVQSFVGTNYSVKSLYHWADRFFDYIQTGQWAKEAVEQIGKVEVEEGQGDEPIHRDGKDRE